MRTPHTIVAVHVAKHTITVDVDVVAVGRRTYTSPTPGPPQSDTARPRRPPPAQSRYVAQTSGTEVILTHWWHD